MSMTEIEQKALALVNEVRAEWGGDWAPRTKPFGHEAFKALIRAIEQHEAFRQEVSDAVEALLDRFLGDSLSQGVVCGHLLHFVIRKPDPLAEALKDMDFTTDWDAEDVKLLRAALAKRGLEIREKSE